MSKRFEVIRWTDEKIAELQSLLDAGHTKSSVAKLWNLDRTTLRDALKRAAERKSAGIDIKQRLCPFCRVMRLSMHAGDRFHDECKQQSAHLTMTTTVAQFADGNL